MTNEELKKLQMQELEERLAMGWMARAPEDDAYFDAVGEAIIEKDASEKESRFADVDETWEKIQRGLDATCTHRQKQHASVKPRTLLRKALAVAAVVAATLACLVLVQASGLNIIGALGAWTDELFRFEPDSFAGSSLTGGADVLPEIRSCLSDNGIPTVFVPKGEMAGMTLEDIETSQGKSSTAVDLLFKASTGETVSFTILYSSDISLHTEMQFEKSSGSATEYVHNGMRFYVFENEFWNTAVWSDGIYTISISGDVTFETLFRIIDSI